MYSGWEAQEVKHNHNAQEFDYNPEVKTGATRPRKAQQCSSYKNLYNMHECTWVLSNMDNSIHFSIHKHTPSISLEVGGVHLLFL